MGGRANKGRNRSLGCQRARGGRVQHLQCVSFHPVEEAPELDFSLFGEEAMEEVKKYTVEAAEKDVVNASPMPDQAGVDLSTEDADKLAPQDAAAPSLDSSGY